MPSDAWAAGNLMQMIVVSTVCFTATGVGARNLWVRAGVVQRKLRVR